MAAVVFGSAEAERIRARDAERERLEALPLHTYEVGGWVTIYFEVEVEARSMDDARSEVSDKSLRELCGMDEGDVEIESVGDLGLAHPEDPEEQEKERALLARGADVVPEAQLL